MNKKYKKEDVLKVMREEWSKKIKILSEDVDLNLKVKIDNRNIEPISDELRVKHKKSKIVYTVVSPSLNDVVLRTPEGEEFMINSEVLEDEYDLG